MMFIITKINICITVNKDVYDSNNKYYCRIDKILRYKLFM